MDKKRAIQIVTKAAKLYRDNLEDQKILFLYGNPKEVQVQLQSGATLFSTICGYETAFHRYNFLHLTGLKMNKKNCNSAIHFYEKCLANRLTEKDFMFSKDGSSVQKLEILEIMMSLKKNVTMISEFGDRGPKLYAEKVAGNISGCIGFIKDQNTGFNVPNTLLKKDIRAVAMKPVYKVYAVLSKDYMDSRYNRIEKRDKRIDITNMQFSKDIEQLLDKERFICTLK